MITIVPARLCKWFDNVRKNMCIQEVLAREVDTSSIADNAFKLNISVPRVSEKTSLRKNYLDFSFGEHNLFLVARALQSLKIDSNTCCFEVSARVRRRDGKLIFPCTYTPQLEGQKLAEQFDRLLFGKLARKLKSQSNQLPTYKYCIVSLSHATLKDLPFLSYAADTCKSHGLPPERFCFQISSISSRQHEHYPRFIEKASRLGFALSLDHPHKINSNHIKLPSLRSFNILSIDITELEQADLRKHLLLKVQERESFNQPELSIIAKHIDSKSRLEQLHAQSVNYYTGKLNSHFVDTQWLPLLLQQTKQVEIPPLGNHPV